MNEPLETEIAFACARALRADAEGDGSLANALRLPTRLALRRDDGTAERFETMFREMDADGSGRVDFEEFFAYFRRLKKERAAEIVASAVVRFDAIEGSGDRATWTTTTRTRRHATRRASSVRRTNESNRYRLP